MSRARVGLIGLVVLATALLPTTAGAKKATTGRSPCTSAYVDMDNNGACTAGDLPLDPLLRIQPYFDESQAVGAYTPPGHPVSIVLDNYRPNRRQSLDLKVSGNLWISGNTMIQGAVYTRVKGDINIADGTRIFARYYLDLNNSWYWQPAHALNIGNGVTINMPHNLGTLILYAEQIHIGTGFRFTGQTMYKTETGAP